MSALAHDTHPDATRGASSRLLNAGLAGLLCFAAASCTYKTERAAPGGPGEITSTQVLELTGEDFAERCAARDGTVEVIPHCGGLNTCKGFSYDQTTSELSEHTCAGAATCAGWNCVIPD